MEPPGGFAASPWAAVLAGHHVPPSMQHEYPHAHAHAHTHAHAAAAMPMDLHVPQPFPYYRYREDALCWSDREMYAMTPVAGFHSQYHHFATTSSGYGAFSGFNNNYWMKPTVDEVGNPTSVNARILELRKEKSRDAARSRRGKENYEFYELAKMLPLPAAITSQLDKASIIRLTISYLKLRDFSGHGDPPWSRDPPPASKTLKGAPNRRTPAGLALELFEQHQGTHILQSLDGFALSVAADGRFLYISETVSIYLGLSQVEMTGSSIFDYIHQADHAEVAEHLGLTLVGSNGSSSAGVSSPSSNQDEDGSPNQGTNNPDVSAGMTLAGSSSVYRGMDRAFCVRMKSTLTKRGCHFKSSGYRVVLMLCRLRPQYSFSHSRKAPPPLLGMVALAIALPPPSVHEIRLESDMFVTRINFDFRIAHCEPKVSDLLDYTAEELTGKNLYTLCHGEDANKLRKCHVDLINKGQVLTHYYRLMNKSGGYTWVQTCATVVCSSKNAEEQNIICVNYVISGREYANLIMDCCQLEEGVQGVKREESGGDPGEGSPDAGADRSGGRPTSPRTRPTGPDPPPPPPPPQPAPQSAPQPQPTPTSQSTRRARKRKAQTEEVVEQSPEENEPPCRSSISPPPPIAPTSPQITPAPPEEIITDTTSVKDLENAMSKHLPSSVLGTKTSSPTTHQPTDFSTDTLLKQQQHKSTIQWIGAHHQLGAPGLPASALLRQLYASRESVIRAAGHGQPPHSHPHSHSHPAGPLPTPPGSEGSAYSDQFIALHAQKNADSFQNLVSTYGGPAYTMDYHSAMTPPGSVSPRDKQQQHPGFEGQYSESLRHSYLPPGESPAQPLPLKPQVYSALEYATPLEQSQFYPSGSGFHLYHPTAKAAPPTSNWYSTAS